MVNFGAGEELFRQDPNSGLARDKKVAALYVEPAPERFEKLVAERDGRCSDSVNATAGAVEDPTISLKKCVPEDFLLANAFATPQTLPNLMGLWQTRFPDLPRPDFVKVDIDSIDCAVGRAYLEELSEPLSRPSFFTFEVVADFPPPLKIVRHAMDEEEETYAEGSYFEQLKRSTHGCSLSAIIALVRKFGYVMLVYTGFDAIFIHKNVVKAMTNKLISVAGLARSGIREPRVSHRDPDSGSRWDQSSSEYGAYLDHDLEEAFLREDEEENPEEMTEKLLHRLKSHPLREFLRPIVRDNLVALAANAGMWSGDNLLTKWSSDYELDEFECYRRGAQDDNGPWEWTRVAFFEYTAEKAFIEARDRLTQVKVSSEHVSLEI